MTTTVPTASLPTASLPTGTLTAASFHQAEVATKIPPGWADNRIAYLGFAAAYLLGHGGTALTVGSTPLIDAPTWIPMILLGAGLLLGTVAATVAATRSQRGLTAHEALPGKLLGLAWITGFLGLFLAITGLSAATGDAGLQTLLWPSGSGLIVGLIYVAEGAMRRDTLHYVLGTFLVVVATAVLLLPTTALTVGTLAVSGGTAYITAAILDQRRRARA
ncbi:ABC transporter permease [Rhodococcus sp. G-MC3]|uniref:ABC transporter permease n=1 Tax=Rhodococcus sp. G-MC3 TaxID=3046209 RepID=UPI0024BBA674|nr:ABC transporter permease [Rhodococcus sp. G-MC3]MDJ0392438.1 ABC transporter permease [Rhodococcus sp. G-MC3]